MTNTQTARILRQNEGHIWAAICNCARHYGVVLSESDEQDIFQTTMVNALSAFRGKAARWDSRRWESVPAYLRTIASHVTVDALRARKAEVDTSVLTATAAAGASPESAYIAAERAESAMLCYNLLPADSRKALDAVFAGKGAGNVKDRVAKHRAVARMRAALA